MASLTDRARDYWDRITPRERRLVVIGAVAAPLILAIWLGMEIRDGLTTIEAKNANMRKALVILADLKARGQSADSSQPGIAFPKEPVSLPTYLADAAKMADFTLKGATPRTPVTRDGFITASTSISVDDLTLDQLKKFLQAVEDKDYVAITHLSISRDHSDKSKVDAKLEVSTYAKPDPAGAGSGSAGSGSAAGGSSTGTGG